MISHKVRGLIRPFQRRQMARALDDDPLGVDDFATHRLPLDAGPEAYEKFQKKEDGYVKVLLQP